jgi:hypothetical protein
MKLQVTITRTDAGANINIRSRNGEANKDYPSWKDALNEASSVGLINSAQAIAAHVMPPGLPFHADADVEFDNLKGQGFTIGKASPPE